jgi:tRNA wybutosine-synthesizing protein 3
MAFNMFSRRKKDILSKSDKSFKGEIDEKILSLCKRINSLPDCYTTSSCSGRVVLMLDREKKEPDLFLKVYHDLISFEELKIDLDGINDKAKENKENIKFKMEACALHVACKSFELAKKIYEKAKLAGWKKSGIISFGKRFIVELTSTEKLEFPVIRKGKILVSDEFLKIIAEDANRKLKKGWKKIENLEKEINNNLK